MEKIQFKVYLNEDLAIRFRELIMKKYHKYEKGLLSYETDMAIRHWLALHTEAQTSLDVNKPNPTPRTSLAFAKVKNYLLGNFYYELKPGQQVARSHLEKAIIATHGSDKRTIRKWLETFHRMGLIKFVTSATFEIL